MSKKGNWRRPRSARQVGEDMADDVWNWRWLFVALLILAVLGRLAEVWGLI